MKMSQYAPMTDSFKLKSHLKLHLRSYKSVIYRDGVPTHSIQKTVHTRTHKNGRER